MLYRRLIRVLALLSLFMAALPAFAQNTQTIYTVQGGDTLASIAARYDVSLDTLMAANGLTNPNTIFAGQQLIVPAANFGIGGPLSGTPATVEVVTAPTSDTNPIQPNFGTGGPLASSQTYTVQPNDNLTAIAARYGVTLEALAAVNNITFLNFITPGQVLVLPQGAQPEPGFGTGGPNLGNGGGPNDATPPTQPSAALRQYVIQPGDILSIIASEQGTTVEVIVALNNLPNPSRLVPGDVLLLP